jgi:hypothetical protein
LWGEEMVRRGLGDEGREKWKVEECYFSVSFSE